MIRIKVCGMVHPENVEKVSSLCPDLMGFIFVEGSKRFVGSDPDPELFRIPGPGILKVGVFANQPVEEVLGQTEKFGLDMVQLHGGESPLFCNSLSRSGLGVIKTLHQDDFLKPGSAASYNGTVDLFLLESAASGEGGSGKKFNWELIRGLKFPVPFLLSGGIGSGDVPSIRDLGHEQLYGVDVNSRFERVPGEKDVDALGLFIKELRGI